MIVRYFGFKLPTTKRLFSIMSEPWILSAKLLFGIILMHTCLNGVNSIPVADEVVKLPGQPPVTFKQFAGYISLDEAKPRSLFYYFVEAESNSSSKPLVLWLNGGNSRYINFFTPNLMHNDNAWSFWFQFFAGPGCSSVGEGAFVEHGPFKPSGSVLVKNEYSWNKGIQNLHLSWENSAITVYLMLRVLIAALNEVIDLP